MTAAIANRDTPEQAGPIDTASIVALAYPVAANTTIFAGTLVAVDANGNAVPASSSNALRVVGRAEKQVVNTVAAGFGTAGQLTIEARPGVFPFANGDGITAANFGSMAYAVDDSTVAQGSSLAGVARTPVGPILGILGSQVKVGVGPLFGNPFPAAGGLPDTIGTLPAFSAGAMALAVGNLASGSVYDVPATAVASTITLPATSPVGTRVRFAADGTKNTGTIQYLDGNGAAALTTALIAGKRHLVECIKDTATAWVAIAYTSP